jgi:type I restriction-modification system DNA methylase subunit
LPAPGTIVPEAQRSGIIHQLVQQFRENLAEYKSARYNEAQLRHEFLDKFFEALGWDVYNKAGYPLDTRDVMVEDSLEIEGHSKSPDYAFKIGKERKFYVEAKKPHVNIKTDFEPAYQLRRYAWSNHLALSVLTDFEEFSLYDCRERPDHGVNPASARLLYVRYEEYPERWDEIASILSKEAVYKGSFDRYVIETKGKKGTTEVDDEFLKDIQEWRKLLAQNIALRNPELFRAQPGQRVPGSLEPGMTRYERQLNFAVQMTIDRIIFLRICEDRGMEPEEQLLQLTHSAGIYQGLVRLFKLADTRYNSGLFHFTPETAKKQAGRNSPDSFTPDLVIDDKVLKEIIRGLYYPCPYVFKEIPVEILGQVYEQFLGRVIRLTPGHQAKVEEKPEVRKAGGVYYTPRYIVDYIVANTVGKPLEGKTPDQASQLKIVDPACGSGSFLLGAFQYLMDWHEDWYLRHEPEKYAKGKEPALIITKDGWRLTTHEKKRILVNNIHGVDIDEQAVEVTKLSLLLKVLEEETGQLSLGFECALPDLGNNIKCGNSLIGSDYFEGQLVRDEPEVERVNPFDWHKQFPEVFRQGGFDAVIGNPPYVRQETLGNDKQYFQKHYQVYAGTADLYAYFIERGISLLSIGGIFSYIVANKWMRANYGEPLRKWLKTKCIDEITDFGDLPVFEGATTYPCIIRVSSRTPHLQPLVTNVQSLDFTSLKDYVEAHANSLDQSKFADGGWSLSDSLTQNVLEKLREGSISLEKYVDGKIYRGILTGLNEAFVIDQQTRDRLISEDPKSAELIKPFLLGRDIKRYLFEWKNRYLIFTRRGLDIKKYPAILNYLLQFKEQLMPKPKDWKGTTWKGRKPGSYRLYEIQDKIDYYPEFEKPKILFPDISLRGNFALDTEGKFYSVNTTYIMPKADKYLLGLLNSTLLTFVYRTISSSYRGGYLRYIFQYVAQLPIKIIDFTNSTEVKQHDRMVSLVEHMLELHKRIPQTPHEKERLEREIASTDNQIDRLVYELYGLTEEEIRIVEGEK